MRLVAILLFCLLSQVGYSHPSWGIAVNNNGEVFFVDILHNNGTLWKVNPEGKLFEVIKNFHAHDLYIQPNSTLWLAENLWIEGEIEGEGRHSLITLSQEEKIDTVLVTLDRDIFNGTSFAIGPDKAIYFLNEGRVYRYNNGKPKVYIDHKFKNAKNMLMDSDGTLWITDSNVENGTLYQFKPSSGLKIFTNNIMPKDPSYPLFKEKRLQFLIGIAKDEEGNIYISENAGCRIIKINGLGEKSVFYQSPTLWSPMNVAFHQGDAFIMEAGFNKVNKGPRIIKKSETGAIQRLVNIDTVPEKKVERINTDQGFHIPNWVYFALSFLVFGLIIILSVRKQHSMEQ